MKFEFIGNPTLKLKYSIPNLKENRIGVQSAQWQGDAKVKAIWKEVADNGKKWRIGFAQLLEMNTMQAVYKKHTRSEILISGKSMPVLDSDPNENYRPFYDDNTATDVHNRPKDVQTSSAAPESVVQLRMWDEPESKYPWWFNNDEADPIQEFVMNLKFSTYIVARDITSGEGIHDPFILKILYQWSVMLDRRYEFTVVKKTGVGPLKADLTKSKCIVKNPSRQPFVAPSSHEFPKNYEMIFQGPVANEVFTDNDTLTAEKRVGEFVKSRRALFGG